MGEMLIVALLGGLITGLSPCIVPVLPVVMAGGSTGTSRARPFLIIGSEPVGTPAGVAASRSA